MISMKKLNRAQRIRILNCLVEGCSIRATCRLTDTAKGTVLKLLEDIGPICSDVQDRLFNNLPCKLVQVDEIWAFCKMKEKNVPEEHKGTLGIGDLWTWTAIDADSKLVMSWLVGERNGETAHTFINDLAGRLANRIQLTSDGLKLYVEAVEEAFGCDIDYAQLVKKYGGYVEEGGERRYSPGLCTGAKKTAIQGDPDMKKVNTSYVERQNLTMRMHMRRFTRLTNGFSRKVENHGHAVALHYYFYNMVKIHTSLRITPAMAAGVTDRLWDLGELVDLLETVEQEQAAANPVKAGWKRGRARKPTSVPG